MKASFFKNKLITLLFGYLCLSSAHASVNLKSVQITDGSQVELLFDGKVDPNLVKTEFVREHIQLSLLKTSVYPAKVNFVQGKELTKVFAYQYAPELVRCRLTMSGDASRFQNRLQIKASGKTLTLRIIPIDTKISQRSEAPIQQTISSATRSDSKSSELSPEETKLVEKVMSTEKEPLTGRGNTLGKLNAPLASGKNPSSSFRFMGVVLFVFGILGLFLFFLKKVKDGGLSGTKNKGLKNFLGKLGAQTGSKKVIQVVSTLSLGPKKSITVVQIQNRMLVLGMSNDSVNLITEFKADDEDFDLSEPMNLKDFATGIKSLENEELSLKMSSSQKSHTPQNQMTPMNQNLKSTAPSSLKMNTPKNTAALNTYGKISKGQIDTDETNNGPAFNEVLKEESTKNSIRAQVRSRLEGLKPL